MVELNHRERTIKVKIVYYGPPVGGKTTNLQILHQHAQAARRGEMISVNSAQDRTILFDLLPLKAAGFRGFDLRLQVLAIPGQAMYAATRRLVLKGADSIVFVANSASDRWEENIQSFREMTQNLLAHQLDPAGLPLVLQYNKRDLPQVTPIEFMDRALNARKVESLPAIAIRGEGVLETFSTILARTMKDLASRYQIIDIARGLTIQQWTQQTITGLFGMTSFATEPNPVPTDVLRSALPPPQAPAAEPWRKPERRTVRVTLPEEAVRMAWTGPDARANETLVESYAQASSQLSGALSDVREERDLAMRRLEDIQHAQSAAQDVLAGQPLESTLRAVLARMADAAGASQASFLVPDAERSLRALALRGMSDDPLLKVPTGVRHVTERFLSETEPRLHQAADSLDLGDALESANLAALVSVPVRTPRGLQGLGILYYTPDAALPKPETVSHLAAVARALGAALELASTLQLVKSAEKALSLALLGTAAERSGEEVVTSLLALRDQLGALRQKPGAPSWFLEGFAYFAPHLGNALAAGRALLAFSRGQVQREAIELEELLEDLRAAGVPVQVTPGIQAAGDPVLLRHALATLVEYLREADPVAARSIQARASIEGGRVRIRIGGNASSAEPASPYGDLQMNAASAARNGDLRLSLVHRIAELHGGGLTAESDDANRRWITLVIPPA